jgi:hypothetical protein
VTTWVTAPEVFRASSRSSGRASADPWVIRAGLRAGRRPSLPTISSEVEVVAPQGDPPVAQHEQPSDGHLDPSATQLETVEALVHDRLAGNHLVVGHPLDPLSRPEQPAKSLLENLCGLLLGCDAGWAGLMAWGKILTPGRNLIGHGGSGIDDGGVSYSPAA